MIVKQTLALCVATIALMGSVAVAKDDVPKPPPNCTNYTLNGHAVIDEETAILEFSTREYARPEDKLWFKVTFANKCPRLKDANFVDIETANCPRHGDVLVFSHRPRPRNKEDFDSCLIDKAENVPVPGAKAPAN